MAQITFSTLSGGNQPLSLFDTQYANQAQWSNIVATAAFSSNLYTLTPVLSGYTPLAYANLACYTFVAANNSTNSVTIKVGSLAALNAYKSDGTTQIGSGDIVSGQAYRVTYNSGLNSSAGGFYLENIGVVLTATPSITGVVDIRTGSATITIPTNATKCKVTLVGGGASGGGCVAALSTPSIGGPGGAGGTCIKYLSGLTGGGTLALTIGAAGAAPSAGNNNGNDGGDTTLASGTQTITTLTAGKGVKGGGAGASAFGTVGTGGASTNGDLNITGGIGFQVAAYSTTDTYVSAATAAGDSTHGRGGKTQCLITSGGAGVAGTGYGAGGTGGIDTAGTNRAGGAGVAGCAIFEWYL